MRTRLTVLTLVLLVGFLIALQFPHRESRAISDPPATSLQLVDHSVDQKTGNVMIAFYDPGNIDDDSVTVDILAVYKWSSQYAYVHPCSGGKTCREGEVDIFILTTDTVPCKVGNSPGSCEAYVGEIHVYLTQSLVPKLLEQTDMTATDIAKFHQNAYDASGGRGGGIAIFTDPHNAPIYTGLR